MKNSKLTNILFSTATALTMLGCSSGGDDDPYTPPVDPPTNGQTPPDGGGNGGGSTADPVFSDDLTKLWIGNFGIGSKEVSAHIMLSKKASFHGNEKYYGEEGLPDDAVIASITGATHYKDGGHPTESGDIYIPWSLQDKTPNVTISFAFVEKEEDANAYIMIDSPMTFGDHFVNYQNDIGRSIEKGVISFHAVADKLTDAVPPLGKDGDTALEKIEFSDVDDITDSNFNSLVYAEKIDDYDLNFKHNNLVSMFKESGKKIWIKTKEIGVVTGDGQRLDLFQPQ